MFQGWDKAFTFNMLCEPSVIASEKVWNKGLITRITQRETFFSFSFQSKIYRQTKLKDKQEATEACSRGDLI